MGQQTKKRRHIAPNTAKVPYQPEKEKSACLQSRPLNVDKEIKMILKALKIFRDVWIGLFCLLIFISIIGIFIGADSFWDGWHKLTEIFSPFNVVNVIVTIVCLSPAIAAHHWIDKIETKQKSKEEPH
jgi:hypothetical protein